ncbi:peptide ABC transporter substrate-binding protein [Cohnella xylanilytica]|uniref:ABC transporter substrate-binding protein n=1 Tax=Cohnella xylanilytica TaxID=557555 RepID=A0A841U3H1_9BACL|nr:ABC transporter substrate-binding protein [Cohnella xylanilytica]MBB6693688.1 ABC transporter substrate-binding protein [Cohnella xylanilytica]GIO15207.1 peptide ABC transporter substrate-binding protein [Cohnella xylanilytica]
MKRSKLTVLLIGLLSSALALAGCSSGNDSAGTTSGGTADAAGSSTASPVAATATKELKIALNSTPTTLDTQMTTDWATTHVARNIFETLITVDANYQIQPMLAESYQISPDGLTYTFKLRHGVKFHNGKEMKAEDVVASMNRWFGKSTIAKSTFAGSTFSQVDDYTVKLQLSKLSGVALQVMTNPNQFAAIMPKEAIEAADDTGVKEYIGTGPFKFVEWKQDQYIRLSKFDEYQPVDSQASGLAGKKEALAQDLYFYFASDSQTRVAGLQSGQYDIALEIPRDAYLALKNNSEVKTVVSLTGYNPLIMNKKKGVFTNEKIRQAVAAALDMKEIMMAAYGDPQFFRLDHGLMQKEQTAWYSDAGKENYNQNNPEKAKQLLQEGGYKGETIRIMSSRDYDDLYNSSVVIKSELENIGMKVQLDTYDWGTVVTNQSDENAWDLFVTTFLPKTDPTQILYLDSRNQWAGWTNDSKIDAALDGIRASTSQEESKKLFEDLQREFWTSVPVIKIGDVYALTATASDVEGFQYFNGPVFWNVSKSD